MLILQLIFIFGFFLKYYQQRIFTVEKNLFLKLMHFFLRMFSSAILFCVIIINFGLLSLLDLSKLRLSYM